MTLFLGDVECLAMDECERTCYMRENVSLLSFSLILWCCGLRSRLALALNFATSAPHRGIHILVIVIVSRLKR